MTKLKDIVFQDTWPGLTVTTSRSFDDPLASLRMFFRDAAGVVGLQLTSAAGGIVVTDASSWSYRVEPIQSFPLAKGTWFWSIEETRASGSIRTFEQGVVTVKLDATYS